jgi:hypothetical protein
MAVISNAVTIADAGAFSVGLGSLVHIKTLTALENNSENIASYSFIHGSSSVVFNNTYPIYIIKFINVMSSGGQNFQMNATTDGSNFNVVSTNTAFVAEHTEDDSTQARLTYSTSYDVAEAANPYLFNINKGGLRNASDSGASGQIIIFNPSNTTFVKHYISTVNSMSEYPGSTQNHVAGYFNTSSALTGIRFNSINSNVMHGTIKLYGLKDS